MNRDAMMERLARSHEAGLAEPWDLVIIGGGATGLGIAIDAAARGYRTLLVERLRFFSRYFQSQHQVGSRRGSLSAAGKRCRWCWKRCTNAV